ncbi:MULTISPECIES: YhcN/YlaJ family sporulation lipoprotein [Solibacillus]|uniref:YhcN/YlaJ family sporulation lipoprotein n=1 Tax=Solibacillus merdavium TaxID=2762218 RepID=A0ABR8XHW3_9BACL|nr:YhcN/YlaJ family sporulation lipoprotein [Solibacillus merdavium]MBD8031529.1 YhcN/YlaJ family sporulation lipoprotein [Solibacillus merdavium]
MRKALLGISLIVILTGCGDREKVVTYSKTDNTQHQHEVEKLFEKDSEIEQVNIVVIENELFVAMQLKPLKKWNRKKIEDRWQKKLEKQFANTTVNVSADFKMFWESTKLMEEKDQKKMMEELQHLKKLAKEET